MEEKKNERLFSLDLLRGLDMFLLSVVGPLWYAVSTLWGPFPHWVSRNFGHAWGVFGLWDIIMPMFIFMCGAAVPFALGRRLKDGHPTAEFWKHLLYRFVLLWVLGMVAQGHLLSYDWKEIAPFNNTLQTIAVGYVIAALVLLVRNKWVRWSVPVVLALVYAVPLAICGDYTRDGNLAWQVEKAILGVILPEGSNVIAHRDPGYTWFATIPMFGVMTLCGMISTEILTAAKEKTRKGLELLTLGAVLLALGWALYPVIPSIKHIYSLTFTAQAMGWCCLALAALYFLSDVWGFRRGMGLFILFGQHALTAYLFADTLFCGAVMKLSKCFVGGLPNLIGTDRWQILFENIGFAILLTMIIVAKHRLTEWKKMKESRA